MLHARFDPLKTTNFNGVKKAVAKPDLFVKLRNIIGKTTADLF